MGLASAPWPGKMGPDGAARARALAKALRSCAQERQDEARAAPEVRQEAGMAGEDMLSPNGEDGERSQVAELWGI